MLSNQRTEEKKGTIDKNLDAQMNKFCIVWDLTPLKVSNGLAFSLTQFKERKGHCNVPRNHQEDECNLGVQLNNQCTKGKKYTHMNKLCVVWRKKKGQA